MTFSIQSELEWKVTGYRLVELFKLNSLVECWCWSRNSWQSLVHVPVLGNGCASRWHVQTLQDIVYIRPSFWNCPCTFSSFSESRQNNFPQDILEHKLQLLLGCEVALDHDYVNSVPALGHPPISWTQFVFKAGTKISSKRYAVVSSTVKYHNLRIFEVKKWLLNIFIENDQWLDNYRIPDILQF